MQIGGSEFQKSMTAPTPGTKILVMSEFSYMPDQIFGKNEKGPKFDLSLRSFPPKGGIQKQAIRKD